jgi:hypothetical protein
MQASEYLSAHTVITALYVAKICCVDLCLIIIIIIIIYSNC